MSETNPNSGGETMVSHSRRHFRVRVVATGYAVVQGRTKKEAVENARTGDFIRTPRPEWHSQVSDIKEIGHA